jgi:hypothetical protein
MAGEDPSSTALHADFNKGSEAGLSIRLRLFLFFPTIYGRECSIKFPPTQASAMSQPASITAAVFEKILAFLAPLFLVAGTGDIRAAQEAAGAILASYGARTNRELRFAALSIAFGFGALESLSRAADPELALNQVLRLRGNANALNRAAQQNETRLDKLLAQPPVDLQALEATPDVPAEVLPTSSATADLLAFARSKLKSMMTVATPAASAPSTASVPVIPLSRQQRRAAERKTEKVRQRQPEEARLAQRTADRMAAAREPMRQNA